ncbi:MAG: prepilin-type N-terminal cleavage/methylation domain-containing protein [Burkholderiales bacterium]|jgi:prepilin-type N-terminal cleavage/methylation domain-containing protein|nr:prepilin-type N-terminal cleavage/methylation domain-containing protein [Burkholderiales bacterium]
MRRSSCHGSQGFTLVELIVALLLLSLISATLFGVFRTAGRSVEAGEQRTDDAASIRLVEDFLRAQWENAHPLRQRKMLEYPLIFEGSRDQLIYVSALPPRVLGGGLWAWRLHVVREGQHGKLVLENTIPDTGSQAKLNFSADKRSVLADRVKSVTFQYYGITGETTIKTMPKWSNAWDDSQRLPQIIRMDVTLEDGSQWPTLYVEMRKGMEAGCRQWNEVAGKCAGV